MTTCTSKTSHDKSDSAQQRRNSSAERTSPTTDELIEQMKSDAIREERQQLLAAMKPALKKKYEWIKDWLKKESTHKLRSRYELGQQVLELDADHRKYGTGAIDAICKVLHGNEDTIYMSLRFVQTFSEQDLDHLCSLVLPNGTPISWSHVRSLLSVHDKGHRDELLEQTVANGWTCLELQNRVYESKKDAETRGRPLKSPKSFDGLLQQQKQYAEAWERRSAKVWSAPDKSLAARAAELPDEEVTEERLSEATSLARHLRHVAQIAIQDAENAERVVARFEIILAKRPKSAATQGT